MNLKYLLSIFFSLFFVVNIFAQERMNQLSNSKSLYLKQHAKNPVDWMPWSADALKKASEEEKLIVISVGYSSCHWCHVMEEETFSNNEVAEVMNNDFISIKVDREERPDIDKIYQNSQMILNGRSGGWPLTMFLCHESLIPFFTAAPFPRFFEKLKIFILMFFNLKISPVDI